MLSDTKVKHISVNGDIIVRKSAFVSVSCFEAANLRSIKVKLLMGDNYACRESNFWNQNGALYQV